MNAQNPKIREMDPAVIQLIAETGIWDMSVPWIPEYWSLETLRRYRQAGFTFASLTVQDWGPPTFEGMLEELRKFRALVAENQSWLTIGSSVAEIEQGRQEGKLVVGLNSQETLPIGMKLSRLADLHAVGVRQMVLAFNIRNFVADGCAEAGDAGLSNYGRQVVKEMNRVGIVIDGSHTGRRSSLEAIELSAHPVIFSHSSAYSITPHIRNVRDDQIRACAQKGGVVGAVGLGKFIGDLSARTESLFRHIDYMVELVGPAHVGLGTDFIPPLDPKAFEQLTKTSWPDPSIGWVDPTGTQPALNEGTCFQPEQVVELVSLMLAKGYPTSAIRGILADNFRRVYSRVCP